MLLRKARQVFWKWPYWFPPALNFPVCCMVSPCCLRTRKDTWLHLLAEAPLLLKPFFTYFYICLLDSLWCTQTRSKCCAHIRQVREISSVCSGSLCCQTHAVVPWEPELAVAFDLSQWCSHCLHASVANDGKGKQFAVSHPSSNTKWKMWAFQIEAQMMQGQYFGLLFWFLFELENRCWINMFRVES